MKNIFFFSIKHELLSLQQKKLQKPNDKYCKEKTAECYLKNKEELKEKSKNRYKNLPEEKYKLKEYQRKRYQQLIQYKKELLLIKQEKPIKLIKFC